MNKKNVLISGVVILMNVAVIAGLFYLFSVIGEQEAEAGDLARKIEISKLKETSNKILEQNIARLKENKLKLDEAFLPRQDILKLIEDIELIGIKSSTTLEFNAVNVGKAGEPNPKLSLSVKGGFERIMRFAYLLENIRYAVNVDRVSVRKAGRGEWTSNFEITLNNIYEPAM